MREDKFRNERFGCMDESTLSTDLLSAGVDSDPQKPAMCTVQAASVRREGRLGRRIAACLIGGLLLVLAVAVAPSSSSAQVSVGISVNFGPPALPYYVQPACPAPGYIWTPGFWAWDPAYGYYWVPGTWVPAPFIGALWTPGYWGFGGGIYRWYPGYWGTSVGFYGGIDYGYGYPGFGYYGGRWDRDRFYYNRSVNRIDSRNIRYVYNQRVVENNRFGRVSYHGGPGGTDARPTRDQLAAERQRRSGPINQQMEQIRVARTNPAQRASVNRGRPEVAATSRPGEFRGNGAVRASRAGAPYREPCSKDGWPGDRAPSSGQG